jgi:hypothetical protein
MNTLIATLLFLVFLFLSTIHFYWAFGGRWGTQAVFPTKEDSIPPRDPGIVATLIVAIGLILMGVFILVQAELVALSIPLWLNKYGLWVVSGIFILRAIGDFYYIGFFKKIKHTKFGINDTKYYSPLCLIIGILTIVLELNK